MAGWLWWLATGRLTAREHCRFNGGLCLVTLPTFVLVRDITDRPVCVLCDAVVADRPRAA